MSVESHAGAGLLGVFGGTFNPIHLGHLRAAEQVVEILGLDRMLFVPAADPPHKREEALAPAELRLAWVRRAVAGNKRFEVDALELGRRGPSFSVDTLREIGARVAPKRPVFVIGCDALAELGSWREPETILRLLLRQPGRGGLEGPEQVIPITSGRLEQGGGYQYGRGLPLDRAQDVLGQDGGWADSHGLVLYGDLWLRCRINCDVHANPRRGLSFHACRSASMGSSRAAVAAG
jgi:nicotinate-nucleotide adenylyltransferase